VNDEGGYQHRAHTKLESGGRIIASGDAMAHIVAEDADVHALRRMI
jgi:hypothetical protein